MEEDKGEFYQNTTEEYEHPDDHDDDEDVLLKDDLQNDSPIELSPDYIRELTKLPPFPKYLMRKFWGYYGKDLLLGHLAPEDRESVRNRAAILVNATFLTMPDYEYNDTILIDILNFKAWINNTIYRSKGGFERIMQTSQTRVATTQHPFNKGADEKKRGFFNRIWGGR